MMITNNNYNYKSPQFTGYVLPSTKKAIRKAANGICKEYLEFANKDNVPLNMTTVRECKELGAKVLTTLDNAMKKFHKDTVLDRSGGLNDVFVLKNTKTGTSLDLVSSSEYPKVEGSIGKIKNNCLLVSSDFSIPSKPLIPAYPRKFCLERLLKFAQCLDNKVNPKDVDEYLFKQYLTNIQSDAMGEGFSRFKALRKAEAAQNMAAEFGVKPDGIAYGIKRKAAEAKILTRRELERKSENNKNFKDIMNS